jgi:precorrin-8X/cobalt-precorrin-8 methylmutase
MSLSVHPIMQASFAMIDREIGDHGFSPAEYAIVQRIIHSTADFEFKQLVCFSPGAIEIGIAALRRGCPIVTDVGMVRQGILNLARQTFNNPIISAVEQVNAAPPAGKTRSAMGILACLEWYPDGIYVVGNAPTALLALCEQIPQLPTKPTLIVGAPVGFIAVAESKAALSELAIPQIRVEGRKGGSSVAAAIVNALLTLAWNQPAGQRD